MVGDEVQRILLKCLQIKSLFLMMYVQGISKKRKKKKLDSFSHIVLLDVNLCILLLVLLLLFVKNVGPQFNLQVNKWENKMTLMT